MDDFGEKLAEWAGEMEIHARFHERLRMLAIEYQDKAITQERFAARTYAEIRAFFATPKATSTAPREG